MLLELNQRALSSSWKKYEGLKVTLLLPKYFGCNIIITDDL